MELINAAVQGRAFQCKAVITSNSDSVNCAVETLQVIPELFRRFTASSIPTDASTVTFEHAFYEINSVSITATDMLSTYALSLTDVSRTGFTATFSQNVQPVAQPYTYNAIGYGRAV